MTSNHTQANEDDQIGRILDYYDLSGADLAGTTFKAVREEATHQLRALLREAETKGWRTGLAQAYKQIELDARNYQQEVKKRADNE